MTNEQTAVMLKAYIRCLNHLEADLLEDARPKDANEPEFTRGLHAFIRSLHRDRDDLLGIVRI